jgi:biofilm protein TabA
MILDTLKNAARYQSLNPRFDQAFAFLQSLNGNEELGRVDLDGDDCFALLQSYETKALENALFEAHRKYIDVQWVQSGRETILWAPLASMREETLAYTAEKDVAKWRLTPDFTPLQIGAGQFAIFWPDDAHSPCLEWGKATQVFKVVVKVAV